MASLFYFTRSPVFVNLGRVRGALNFAVNLLAAGCSEQSRLSGWAAGILLQ